MKRYALPLAFLLVLAGCSNDEPSSSFDAPPPVTESLPQMPPNDEAEILDLGQGIEMHGKNGEFAVQGTVAVTGYSWHPGPVEAYGVEEQGPFLVVNVEWDTEQVYFFDDRWLVFDDGGETQWPDFLGGALGDDVPEDGGDGVVAFSVREQKAGTLWLRDEYGVNRAGWKIDAA